MKINGPFKYGEFLSRPNRFLALCEVNGQEVSAYIPNPGPMPELLTPNVEVLLRYVPQSHRKTDYDLICVRHQGKLLSIDTRIPNQLLTELLPSQLAPFAHYESVYSEPIYRNSRLDFLLRAKDSPPCLIEAKSSTHAEQDIGYFPRAVTERGHRHLHELMEAIKHGYRAAIVFIIQRPEATRLRPNDHIDPAFGEILRLAVNNGVEAYAWTTTLDESSYQITLVQSVPVDLSPPNIL